MKFHESSVAGRNSFTGYGEGYVQVNNTRHETSVIVTAGRILPWSAASFDELKTGDFDGLAAMALEIVLLGTGMKLRFPHPRLTQSLARARIGFEAMDLHAACRTYNILLAEDRKVAAALLFA